MSFPILSNGRPFSSRINETRKGPLFLHSKSIILSSQHQNPKANSSMNRYWKKSKPYFLNPLIVVPEGLTHSEDNKSANLRSKNDFPVKGCQKMIVLCGIGYFVNGFRCFPLLGLNFHMASCLRLDPSVLQVVQIAGTLPMVAKPLYGILSDALSIGGAHRIPWISVGVILQVLSWGLLALIPAASKALPALIASVLLSNAGASIAEFAKDALVVEYGQNKQIPGLQSYAFMASAAGGILGNLLGGFFLLQTQNPKSIFLAFVALLAFQLTLTLPTREESLGGVQRNTNDLLVRKSMLKSIKEQYNMLIMMVISDKRISSPLLWVVASVMTVPILSGAIFCYQTQTLNLAPSVIGMSKVIGQLMLLALTVMYDRFWKRIPMRKLIGTFQIIYASSVLLDLVLVNQLNLKLGIPNERFVLCFSGVAETIAQFKLLPFLVLFASLAPPGCEGSLMSILASALCLSSMVSSFFGVGLASLLGITSGNYSSLPFGILIQFLAALLPIMWIDLVPAVQDSAEEEKKQAIRKRSKNRIKRLSFEYDPIYSYMREKEPDLWG